MSMVEYEILYLVGDSKKVDLDRIKSEVEAMIVAEGGVVQTGEFVDERRMEYAIGKERRGVYIAKRFMVKEGSGDVSGTLSKKLLLRSDILRFLVVRAEGLPSLEESQERVKRSADTRRSRPQGRYVSNRERAPRAATPTSVASDKPALSDTEIDKKLGEVLDI